MGVVLTSTPASSPEWMASMMARVNFSLMRLPVPYLHGMHITRDLLARS